MTETGTHPAVFAGLLGSIAWGGAPTVALATPVDNVVDAISYSLVLQFVVGCAIGAAVAGALTLIADIVARGRAHEPDDDMEDDFWASSSLNLLKAEEKAGEDDPTGDLNRFRTGQLSIDLPFLADQAVAAAVTGPRHFARSDARRADTKAVRRTGRHFVDTVPVAKASAPSHMAPPSRGRHFAGNAPVSKPVVALETPAAIGTGDLANAPMVEVGELHGRARLAMLPVIEPRRSAVRAPQTVVPVQGPRVQSDAAMSDTNDLMRPGRATAPRRATNRRRPSHSEQKLGITGRLRLQMAARAKGVRAVLAERLGSEALEGVPIIARGDGSTVDIQPSWFDQTVVPALASITGITPRVSDTAPRMGDEPIAERVETETPSRASYISRRVAEVNVGVFPELRTGDELGQEDAFEQALAAMGEDIAPLPSTAQVSFQDVVGGPSTIDDPDGLEGPTGFIPFRVPAAHPEVVDTDTYVDYLLRDEISLNGSPVLNRSPHAHLRVIEGGTGRLRTKRRSEEAPSATQGRHFAPAAAYAAEA